MIAIKDFKMPKSCSECPFDYDYLYCVININAYKCKYKWTEERSAACPLIEVEEVKK